jgi:hypothetical protein
VINTGSFSRPLGGLVIELSPSELRVRRVNMRREEFCPGEVIAKFPL